MDIKKGGKMNKQLRVVLVFCALVVLTSQARAVYIGADNGSLYDYDVSTNTKVLIGNTVAMYDIALDPISGTLYGVDTNANLVSIDTTNASTTFIGRTVGVNGLTFDSSGALYGTGNPGLFSIDTSTGSYSLLGNTGFSSSGDIAFNSSGDLFLSAKYVNGSDQLVNITSTLLNGTAGTSIGAIGFDYVYGLNLDSSDTLYGFTLGWKTLTIDTTTGIGTHVATNYIRANGADGSGGVSAVPVPAAVWLFGSGILGLVGVARRKA